MAEFNNCSIETSINLTERDIIMKILRIYNFKISLQDISRRTYKIQIFFNFEYY